MSCEEIQDYLDAYADGELDLARSLTVERHLEACQECRSAYEAIGKLSVALRNESLYFRASGRLATNIRTALLAEDATPAATSQSPGPQMSVLNLRSRPGRGSNWQWLTLAACLALVTLAALVVVLRPKTPSADELLAREVVSNHIRSLMEPGHHVDVPSSDKHTVKPWFNGRLDFSPPVENPSDQGFPLIGGRLDYLGGRSVAALVYQHNQHYINLFIWPKDGGPDLPEVTSNRQGYNLVHWQQAGMECWAISDLNLAELQKFTELIEYRPDLTPKQN